MHSRLQRALAAPLLLILTPLAGCTGGAEPPADPPTRPQRIVSLSPTATEILFAIGAGDAVVAVDEQSDYPPEAPTTDLSLADPNVEAISSYDPDLVVVAFDPGGLVDGLERIGVPVLLQPAADTLDDTYAQIAELGVTTGREEAAAALIERMRADIAKVVAELPDRPEPLTYYHELDGEYFTVTSGTFIGQLYAMLGMRSIADDADSADDGGEQVAYPKLSPEFILARDPDVILLADVECCGVDAAALADRPGWDELTAVREGRVIELDDDLASRWGPRVVDLLALVAEEVAAVTEPAGAPAG